MVIIPIKLGKAFTTAFLFAEEAVKEYLLLESFLAYLSSDERELVNLSLWMGSWTKNRKMNG